MYHLAIHKTMKIKSFISICLQKLIFIYVRENSQSFTCQNESINVSITFDTSTFTFRGNESKYDFPR